ncbi:MAG: glycosyltransferase family 39 protein [Nitrospirota bacterium]
MISSNMFNNNDISRSTAYYLLIFLFFLIFLTRILFLVADHSFSDDFGEELISGLNARDKVLFNDWEAGKKGHPFKDYLPLPNLVNYATFSFFGVGIFQYRVSFVLINILSLFLFYLILKKEFQNRLAAFLGLSLFAFADYIIIFQRSGMSEGLFGIFVILIFYCVQKTQKNKNYYFLLGFLSFGIVWVKLSGVLFFASSLAGVSFLLFKEREQLFEKIKLLMLGIISAVVVFVAFLAFADSLDGYFGYMFGLGKWMGYGRSGFSIVKTIMNIEENIDSDVILRWAMEWSPIPTLMAILTLGLFASGLIKRTRLDNFVIAAFIAGFILGNSIWPEYIVWRRYAYLIPFVFYFAAKLIWALASYEENIQQSHRQNLRLLFFVGLMLYFRFSYARRAIIDVVFKYREMQIVFDILFFIFIFLCIASLARLSKIKLSLHKRSFVVICLIILVGVYQAQASINDIFFRKVGLNFSSFFIGKEMDAKKYTPPEMYVATSGYQLHHYAVKYKLKYEWDHVPTFWYTDLISIINDKDDRYFQMTWFEDFYYAHNIRNLIEISKEYPDVRLEEIFLKRLNNRGYKRSDDLVHYRIYAVFDKH